MFYLFWAFLNIALGLFFLFVCIKATKLIRQKLGIVGAIVFVFVLVSFACAPRSKTDKDLKTGNVKNWKFQSSDSLWKISHDFIVLDKNWLSEINLYFQYGENKNTGLKVPTMAYSDMPGFIGGYNWKPVSINVYSTDENHKLAYSVVGNIEWTLLGLTVYHQLKTYDGEIEIK